MNAELASGEDTEQLLILATEEIEALELSPKASTEMIEPRTYGLTEADLRQLPPDCVWEDSPYPLDNAWEAVQKLLQVYTAPIAFEFGHVHVKEERRWLKGSLVFIRPGKAHSFRLTSASSLEAYNIYCDLWGKPERSFSHFAFQTSRPDPQFMPPAASCPELDALPTHARVPVHSPLTDWFVRIFGWHGSPDGNAEALVSSLMKAWLLHAHNELRSEAPYDRRIARILQRMEREPEARFSYEEMSRNCGLEKSHFYSLFKSVTGMAPKAYQLRLKMKKAAALLLESDQSVTRISEQLGYGTVHYFSKQFADYHRLSPTQYRTLRRGGGGRPI
ncbi:helix-turn-helix domain-containing protein [Paenibacillaceae bacterium WGS1546]|uniref:AraC family transcriptional regulator n=1 Tax=Cohnella sp. WGS1546 TaxID=3366810 RepID=UPI00372D784D